MIPDRSPFGSQKGVVLILTLSLVTILTVAALEMARKAAMSTDTVLEDQDRFRAEQAAMSGIHLAMAVLADDASTGEIDSVQEPWADSGLLSDLLAGMHPEAREVSLEIVDEMGKIQVNALVSGFPGNAFNDVQRELWERMLALVFSGDKSLDVRDPTEIINCVKDWLDSEDDDLVTGTSGAEEEYYRSLDPPVACANGPLDTLDEFLLIKGISMDILAVKSTLQESSRFSGIPGVPELDEVFTVLGMDTDPAEAGGYRFEGRININTAGPLVLAAMLPAGREDQAEELVEFRTHTLEQGGVFVNALDKGWYEQVIELSDKERDDLRNLVRHSSEYFRARASLRVGTAEATLLAFIKREKDTETGQWRCRLLGLSRR
jgi:general secretion pathway protein K